MSRNEEIEFYLPPPEPAVRLHGADDAWMLCGALRGTGDALLAVLADSRHGVVAVAAAGRGFVRRALDDPSPFVRLIERFEPVTVYLAPVDDDAELLVDVVRVAMWPTVAHVWPLPSLPESA